MNSKKLIWISNIVLLVSLLNVFAIPIPHTIRGTVFDIDGITEVTSKTQFSIKNIDSGSFISGIVGKGPYTGMYSASIQGFDGDRVLLLFWNKYHNVSINVSLSGVMQNVDVLLNDSYPDDAPVFFSTPIISIEISQTYMYDVDAFDVQDEQVSYSLIEFPNGMVIDSSGIIEWKPEALGAFDVVVRATDSDGLFTDQSFQITVEPKKVTRHHRSRKKRIPPTGIISLTLADSENRTENNNSVTNTSKNIFKKIAITVIDALNPTNNNRDIDTTAYDEQTKKRIVFGLIHRLPQRRDLYDGFSQEKAIVSFEDERGTLKNVRTFSLFGKEFYFSVLDVFPSSRIKIKAKNNLLSGNVIKQISGFFTRTDINLNKTFYQETPQTTSNGFDFFVKRPFPFFKSPQRPIYQYVIDQRIAGFTSYSSLNVDVFSDITFSVSKDWIESLNVSKDSVELLSYSAGIYSPLETRVIDDSNSFVTYLAIKNNSLQRYFVISINKMTKTEAALRLETLVEQRKTIRSGVTALQPFLVEGDVEITKGIPFPVGSLVTIRNKNEGTIKTTRTGIANNPGAFSIIVEAKRNDDIEITVSDGNNIFTKTMNISGDVFIE